MVLGKSTLIKVLAGVHTATSGSIIIDGKEGKFSTPRQATDAGIGTVYQDLALNALTSVTRNFFSWKRNYKRTRIVWHNANERNE